METEPPKAETEIADPTSDHGSSGKPFVNFCSFPQISLCTPLPQKTQIAEPQYRRGRMTSVEDGHDGFV